MHRHSEFVILGSLRISHARDLNLLIFLTDEACGNSLKIEFHHRNVIALNMNCILSSGISANCVTNVITGRLSSHVKR